MDPGVGYTGCVTRAPRTNLIVMSIATITTYAIFLIAMLVGLLRQRNAREFGLWNMLCQQVWYLLMAISRGLINIPDCLGMDMVCFGGGGRGAYSGEYSLIEVACHRSCSTGSCCVEHQS